MTNNLIPWKEIYNLEGLFHIYLTERKRGKTDGKAWSFLEEITSNKEIKFAWLRRHWHDSLECTKPYFQDLIYKFCEDKELKPNSFEVQEQGLFYEGKKRIYFFDLFSFRKARGKIARGTVFSEIVYEEAIPIDQEVLPREQWKLKDFIESLKITSEQILKVTFLANPYIFSMYFLKDGLSLFRVLGAIEGLTNFLNLEINSVNVLKVKELTKKLFKGEIKIEEVKYQQGRGKGWMFNDKRINIHQLEAYLVYYLFKNKK